jgi:hypothetical protein
MIAEMEVELESIYKGDTMTVSSLFGRFGAKSYG